VNSNKRVYDYNVHCVILISCAVVALYMESLNTQQIIYAKSQIIFATYVHTHLNMLISFIFFRRV
jgi:hypothetical protein